ncbi:MAG: serine/threonine protein phosphatase [Treponema sp.]|jgi:UDP-2,3-diacylglucosamine pyrophosphatase LpxH|nr:serine/threonine protein phosphatase [Treponema sp.]
MSDKLFLTHLADEELKNSGSLDISNGGKILIISDLHMGSGNRDDLSIDNGEMLICLLEEYYFKNGWILVLNGDIEELQRYSLDLIREKWVGLYRVFNLFARENRLYKIIGNHDEQLLLKRYSSYPYQLYTVLKIETGTVPAYVFHGHQLSSIYSNFNKLMGIGIRYILKPFGIRNIIDARNPHKRFHIEKKAYAFAIKNRCLSIIGHTHRPLFESLGRFDYIKFEIERLCQKYPSSQNEDRIRIENEVTALRKELSKLKRKERQDVLRQSLYGDELPVPGLFNSGCTLGKKGINAIELTNKDIALVYWFIEGKSKKFIKRGGYEIKEIPNKPYRRAVLNQNKLDYILAKIKLLGNN